MVLLLFSISLVDGCSDNAEGNRDETYDEATDTSYPPVISLVGSSTIYLEVRRVLSQTQEQRLQIMWMVI